MATIVTNFLADSIRLHVLGIQAMPVPTTTKIALYTVGTGIIDNVPTGEVVDPNYQRMSVTFNEEGSSEPFHFEGMSVEVTISHVGFIGNIDGVDKILFALELDTPKTFVAGEPIWFEEGKVDLSIFPN